MNPLERATSIYEIAYLSRTIYGEGFVANLISAVESVITNTREEKKMELLGEDCYLDYLNYKKKMEEEGIKYFSNVLDYMASREIELDDYAKVSALESLIEDKQITLATLIAAKLSSEHFSIEKYKEEIKRFEYLGKANKN